MALDVSITKDSTYTLKCDVIDHSFTRLVTQTGLPSSDEGDSPTEDGVFIIDLGICIEQLTITGVVDDTASGTDASKSNMETVVRGWWAFGDTAANLLKISLPNSSYYGSIRNSSFRKTAGIPDRWEFSLTFLIKSQA